MLKNMQGARNNNERPGGRDRGLDEKVAAQLG